MEECRGGGRIEDGRAEGEGGEGHFLEFYKVWTFPPPPSNTLVAPLLGGGGQEGVSMLYLQLRSLKIV